ncbi:MAG: flagellar export chaperone FliS [Bryobacteraceae bacterium]|nr:flagellar export chaperone FliS [Bryobacteraceae bacterium]
MNPYDQYLESSVLTATPLELVTMLYRCALDGIADARRCLLCGDIEGRVRPVNRAFDAVIELSLSLDFDNGGELSRNLGELYGYITNQIVLGHCNQSDTHFAEAARLLTTLLESWQQVSMTADTRMAGAAA